MIPDSKRYEVVEMRTGERFGNHTYAEACSRAQAMRRAWQYKKSFQVLEREAAE
jgi:hypothetical protein